MTPPRISDNPSIRKPLEDMENLKMLQAAMPVLAPILKQFGVDVDKINGTFSEVGELERLTYELATIPDRFNDLFASRGWIIYDLMSIDVARAAIQKAESGDIDGAEADLVSYYDPETVRLKLQTMFGVKAFRLRMPLAQKALADYTEERYHACIPVILALMDGMVNELHEKQKGFFAKEVSLEAWDSLAGHDTGLNQLVKIMARSRRTTTAERITIPYRNGILHGMDLGYDNKMVAAKSWAALFAAREWALRAEQGRLTAPPERPKKTIWETLRIIKEHLDESERIKQWRPRELEIGITVPTSGAPDKYESGTPEQKLAQFLDYWKRRNYGHMARCIGHNIELYLPKPAAAVKLEYTTKRLLDFQFTCIIDIAHCVSEIETLLSYEQSGQTIQKIVKFRLLNEDKEGEFVARGHPTSEWFILNWRAS